LRLTHEQGLSVREVGLRLKLSKTTVATYLLRENGGAKLGHGSGGIILLRAA
jgi:predicted transcriptional regulator